MSQEKEESDFQILKQRNKIDKISISTKMSDEDFMIHVLNNLTEDYDVVLDGLESRLMLNENDPNKLTIEDVRVKLSW